MALLERTYRTVRVPKEIPLELLREKLGPEYSVVAIGNIYQVEPVANASVCSICNKPFVGVLAVCEKCNKELQAELR